MTDTKIVNGVLSVDISRVVDLMDQESKDELCKSLLAEETLFEAVVDQLAHGSFFDSWWFDSDRVTTWRAKLVGLMPETIALLVKHLIWQRDRAKASEKRMHDWAWAMYHAWPDAHRRSRPELERFQPTNFPTDETVAAIVEGKVQP